MTYQSNEQENVSGQPHLSHTRPPAPAQPDVFISTICIVCCPSRPELGAAL